MQNNITVNLSDGSLPGRRVVHVDGGLQGRQRVLDRASEREREREREREGVDDEDKSAPRTKMSHTSSDVKGWFGMPMPKVWKAWHGDRERTTAARTATKAWELRKRKSTKTTSQTMTANRPNIN